MDIKSVVVHEIKKQENVTGAQVITTDIALDHLNPVISGMIEKLDASFRKKHFSRAKFNEDGFKKTIADFENINLIEESKELAVHLKNNIQGIAPAKGGYLLFCEYKNLHNFLVVFLIRDIEGEQLELKDDNSWDVKRMEHLEVKNFAMGARINLDVLNSESEDRYIVLVKGSTDVAGYFENWIGIDDTKAEAKDADALYEVSKHIDLPEGVGTRDDLKRKIYDFVKSQPSKRVNVRDLSKHLYDDEEKIVEYCDENQIDIDGEFKLTSSQLRKFYKLIVVSGDIELRADRSSFNPNRINVSDDGESVVIYSKELADAIRNSKDE